VRVRLLICRDLYYPSSVRAGGRPPAPFIVPGADFQVDGWRASRLSIVQAVANGVPMARSAAAGRLTVTDARGRVLGEATQAGHSDGTATGTASLLATMPSGTAATPYARFGDWFAWLSLVAAGGALLSALRRPAPRSDGVPAGHR